MRKRQILESQSDDEDHQFIISQKKKKKENILVNQKQAKGFFQDADLTKI